MYTYTEFMKNISNLSDNNLDDCFEFIVKHNDIGYFTEYYDDFFHSNSGSWYSRNYTGDYGNPTGYSFWFGILEMSNLWNVNPRKLVKSLIDSRVPLSLPKIERLVFISSLETKQNENISKFFTGIASYLDSRNPVKSLMNGMDEMYGQVNKHFGHPILQSGGINRCHYEPIMILFIRASAEKRRKCTNKEIDYLTSFHSSSIDFEAINNFDLTGNKNVMFRQETLECFLHTGTNVNIGRELKLSLIKYIEEEQKRTAYISTKYGGFLLKRFTELGVEEEFRDTEFFSRYSRDLVREITDK